MRMNFHVSGPRNSGTVFVHMVKPTDASEWEYRLLALEVKGLSTLSSGTEGVLTQPQAILASSLKSAMTLKSAAR